MSRETAAASRPVSMRVWLGAVIVWLVFLLTLISLWPLKAWTGK
jgi:hypothetical protein